MEIKEEKTSDEAQHFLPATQANNLREPQFTSKHVYSLFHVTH
uniref:Uncharacterized protein n=1 Tax=Chelydra serpentina TaxID=8475 RepID=A0A8C3XW85_CHESE